MSQAIKATVPRAFLTAEWRNLVMLNWAVDPAALRPFLPVGTELDSWQGVTFVSLIGFLFANTRVFGVPIPWHRTFEEVNLRFYVRRDVDGETRRAVTFIRELVPRAVIAWAARAVYNEPYRALSMRHHFGAPRADGVPGTVQYEWRSSAEWTSLKAEPSGEARAVTVGSQEEFITEHYWGYTRQRDGSTVEYRVEHPSWRVWSVRAPHLEGNLVDVYGPVMARILNDPPTSAFVADGSPVTVFAPVRLPHQHQASLALY
jgi:uncharacterized protein YqjF (DUF2071 family)